MAKMKDRPFGSVLVANGAGGIAAGATDGDAGRFGSATRTSCTDCSGRTLPSTLSVKSLAVRSATGSPCASVASTSIETSSADDLKGVCADKAKGRRQKAQTKRRREIFVTDALIL